MSVKIATIHHHEVRFFKSTPALITPIQPSPTIAVNDTAESKVFAAVDLGSNSFHMVISRYERGEFVVLDRQRAVIRLGGGLDRKKRLDQKTADRALDCLLQFGQLLRDLPADQVRVVGTNALRQMKDKSSFLEQAERALGHNIEIIAGREEARLIYLGVSKWSGSPNESRLVIDIGGGSTEIIVGRGDTPLSRESLEIGCVSLSRQYFADGNLTAAAFDAAQLDAELAIRPVVKQFRLHGWNTVIGCSGTMKAFSQALIEGGLSSDELSSAGLQKLKRMAIEMGSADKLSLPGITDDRKPVFAGGLSILLAIFEMFEMELMTVSDIALREGVLYDLVGRSGAEDIRDQTVSAMIEKWAIDPHHGDRVSTTALTLYDNVEHEWDIHVALFRNTLRWAAKLHELGLLISHDGYHKHGAYLAANADMAGFARRDQLLLSALILGHRKKFPLDHFEQLPASLVTPAKRIAVLLRLAVLLQRDRTQTEVPETVIDVNASNVNLRFPVGWLNDNPLTAADLKREQMWLKAVGIRLSFD